MTTTTPIAGLQPLSSVQSKLIRLGIIGEPNSGKTWAAATFPNPVYVDFDNKLRALKEFRPDLEGKIQRVAISDPLWLESYAGGAFKSAGVMAPPNRRDASLHWLRNEAKKLPADTTLIWDSFSMFQDAVDQQGILEPVYAKGGGIDTWARWNKKIDTTVALMELLKGATCNIVVTFHETKDRDEAGNTTGGIKPLMTGQFADKIAGYFTDFYRQLFIPKLNPKGEVNIINGKPLTEDGWYWQIRGDHIFKGVCSLVKDPTIKYVKAQYDSLISQ